MPAKKKPKERTAEWYRKKAVTLAKKIARTRDGFKCRYCGVGEPQRQTHGSHIYSEGVYRSMSADLDNIICLCAGHHVGFYRNTKTLSWHNNPMEMVEWFKEKFPELAEDLKKRSQQTKKMGLVEWKRKYEELKQELSNLS